MKLLVERIVSDSDTTIGMLWINGVFRTFTCEDEFRFEKVAGETRIPTGVYRVELRASSPMADRYRQRFGTWHDGMIWIQDVPNFKWIYIHAGNHEGQTDGCILVGYGAMAARHNDMKTIRSRDAYESIAKDIFRVLKEGEQVDLEIVDRDRRV